MLDSVSLTDFHILQGVGRCQPSNIVVISRPYLISFQARASVVVASPVVSLTGSVPSYQHTGGGVVRVGWYQATSRLLGVGNLNLASAAVHTTQAVAVLSHGIMPRCSY